ncbi:MAG: hypothetical protein ACO3JG_13270 [Luteolibacter sp.]
MALRIGRIAMQYSKLDLPPKQNYRDTLNLCLLQNLLTHCKELTDEMARENGEELGLKVPLSEMTEWGLDEVEIRENAFEGNLTVEVLLTHLRNAVSHPTGTNLEAEFPSTGYNSISDLSGMIARIGFCNSPDTKYNRPKSWRTRDLAEKQLANLQRSGNPWNYVPHDVSIGSSIRYGICMHREGYPYARIFVAVFTIGQLNRLLLGLANLLAQPARDHWDGRSTADVIAA